MGTKADGREEPRTGEQMLRMKREKAVRRPVQPERPEAWRDCGSM